MFIFTLMLIWYADFMDKEQSIFSSENNKFF